MNKQYVLGILVDEGGDWVALLRKSHGPSGMAGTLNGVGGKVKAGESSREAMDREGREEIGVTCEWNYLGKMQGYGWEVALYRAFDSEAFAASKGLEDEAVEKVRVDYLLHKANDLKCADLLRSVVALAVDPNLSNCILYA